MALRCAENPGARRPGGCVGASGPIGLRVLGLEDDAGAFKERVDSDLLLLDGKQAILQAS